MKQPTSKGLKNGYRLNTSKQNSSMDDVLSRIGSLEQKIVHLETQNQQLIVESRLANAKTSVLEQEALEAERRAEKCLEPNWQRMLLIVLF